MDNVPRIRNLCLYQLHNTLRHNMNSIFTGYGAGYNLSHKDESGLTYLPEGMEDQDFFTNCEDDDGG